METKIFIEMSNNGKQLTINGDMDLLSQLLWAMRIEPTQMIDNIIDIPCYDKGRPSPKTQEAKHVTSV